MLVLLNQEKRCPHHHHHHHYSVKRLEFVIIQDGETSRDSSVKLVCFQSVREKSSAAENSPPPLFAVSLLGLVVVDFVCSKVIKLILLLLLLLFSSFLTLLLPLTVFISFCSSQVRKFVSKDSAGLRVRSHPSLQSEQIGIVHVNGTITFIDEVTTTERPISRELLFIQADALSFPFSQSS